MMGEAPVPKWLAVDGLSRQFGSDRADAREHYRRFVLDGVGRGIWEESRQQIYPGDEAFVERMQAKANVQGDVLTVPRAQRRPPAAPLADIAAGHRDRNTAIVGRLRDRRLQLQGDCGAFWRTFGDGRPYCT